MMQAMRDRVKLIYWVVIITFVLLTFLVWGIGLDGGGSGAAQSGVVARVNGTEIGVDQWQNLTGNLLAQMRQQSGDRALTENQRLRARQQAFDQLIDETLQRTAAAQMGITVTDEEIVDLLSNDPPPFLLEQFRNAEGEVDYQRYFQALADPTVDWGQVENMLRANIPLQKLYNRIAGAALVGEGEIREAYLEQNARAVAEYVGMRFVEIELGEESIPDSELQAYYDSHIDEYQQGERARVRVVRLPKEPSEEDETEVVSILNDIRTDIEEGVTTFADAAKTFSEDTSASDGGDLGWFDRNRMVAPFTESAFSLPIGAVSEPVRTQFGYHLITVADERLGDDGEREEILASHILVRVDASTSTQADLRDRFTSFHDKAAKQGLEAAASEAEFDITTPAPFQEGANIPGIGNSLEGSAFAFANDSGAISPMIETQDDFYCVEVVERLPEGPRPLEEVRALVEGAVERERRAEVAAARVAEAWQRIEGGEDMASVAKDLGLSHAVTDTFSLRQSIPDVGFASEFARAALASSTGESIPEVRTNNGVFGLRVLWHSEFDEADFRAQRASIAQSLLFDRRRRVVEAWMEDMREDAQIEDFRSQVL